jgi:hypothetical protein
MGLLLDYAMADVPKKVAGLKSTNFKPTAYIDRNALLVF